MTNRLTIIEQRKGVFTMNTPDGRQQTVCLPLDYLDDWLVKINASSTSW